MDNQQNCGKNESGERSKKTKKWLLFESAMPRRCYGMNFDNFAVSDNNRAAYELARKYEAGFEEYVKRGVGLYIYGPYGVGKTHLAASIALNLMYREIPCAFTTAEDIFSVVKLAYDDKESKYDALEDFTDKDLLVIDDLGKCRATAWTLDVLYSIVSQRHEWLKPTIITTNYSERSLREKFTLNAYCGGVIDSLISRLHECSQFVELAGNDHRDSATEYNTL
jgi:DNA replication protein DnaC